MFVYHSLAPAKINLTLQLGPRSPERGLHEISSLMQTISIYDELRWVISPATGNTFRLCVDSRISPPLPADDNNLVCQAVKKWLNATGLTCQIALRLTKRIPMGAGLGGGSSDAAAVLRTLQQQFPTCALAHEDLLELALQLGSDVPFFLFGGLCRVSGYGEKVVPLTEPADAPTWGVLVKPPLTISTPAAFAAWDQAALHGEFRQETLQAQNAFAPLLLNRYSLLQEIRDFLTAEAATTVNLSGSGPSLYALCFDQDQQARLLARCQSAFPDCTCCGFQTLPRQPGGATSSPER